MWPGCGRAYLYIDHVERKRVGWGEEVERRAGCRESGVCAFGGVGSVRNEALHAVRAIEDRKGRDARVEQQIVGPDRARYETGVQPIRTGFLLLCVE